MSGEANFAGLQAALDELGAIRIAVPRFDAAVLARGHAVHYRFGSPSNGKLRPSAARNARRQSKKVLPIVWLKRVVENGHLAAGKITLKGIEHKTAATSDPGALALPKSIRDRRVEVCDPLSE